MFAAILSDCGVALYSNQWWSRRTPSEWGDIIREARLSGYKYVRTIEMYRALAENLMYVWTEQPRYSHEALRKFSRVRAGVRDQHRKIYEWFLKRGGSKSRNPFRRSRLTYLDIIPADIRGIIGNYLKINYSTATRSMTAIMGLRHSFDDLPAVIYPTTSAWYRFGKLHRDVEPAIVACSPTSGLFIWYNNGTGGRIGYGYTTITYNCDDDEIVFAIHQTANAYHFNCTRTNPFITAEIRRLHIAYVQ